MLMQSHIGVYHSLRLSSTNPTNIALTSHYLEELLLAPLLRYGVYLYLSLCRSNTVCVTAVQACMFTGPLVTGIGSEQLQPSSRCSCITHCSYVHTNIENTLNSTVYTVYIVCTYTTESLISKSTTFCHFEAKFKSNLQ